MGTLVAVLSTKMKFLSIHHTAMDVVIDTSTSVSKFHLSYKPSDLTRPVQLPQILKPTVELFFKDMTLDASTLKSLALKGSLKFSRSADNTGWSYDLELIYIGEDN
ncbi:hypothetical protein Ac42p037 [Acinetobacter phage Ac42]|uniref:hypothetical protein n=1 Tax=Acinetobacter phage Ac42 TaxID=762660 RepID=UPI0001EBCC87|nr:hypothetical protein Ac42p037 [Acinetobacter phage Ac42]ADI96275.1 hypothetical protein Ac42p037 [Acinetobacter phage Ac42]